MPTYQTTSNQQYQQYQQQSGPAWQDAEREARLKHTEAAVLIEKILRAYSVCDDGKRIAWRSASMIQKALDAARRGD
jgi:hypothetical protein